MQRILHLTQSNGNDPSWPLWDFARPRRFGQEKVHKVGYIADLSGPMQDNYAPIYEAFDYYVKELNARGGIDGVPVRLFVRDDSSTRPAPLR